MSRTLTFRAILGSDGLEPDRTLDIDANGVVRDVRPGGPPYDGFLAIPGMPNAHSHVFQRALAGFGEAASGPPGSGGPGPGGPTPRRAGIGRPEEGETAPEEDSFWSWRDAMYRLAGAITAEQLYDVARFAFAEMLRAGYTRVVEFHYLHHDPDGGRSRETSDAVVSAAGDVGLPLSFLPVYYRTSGFGGDEATSLQRRFCHRSVDEFLAMLEGLGGLAAGVAPHSLRAVPTDDLATLVRGVDAILGSEAPLHIHVSEQEGEVAECSDRFGRTPIQLLDETVGLDSRWSLVHATHATAGERARIRESGATLVLCPLTEAYLGDGLFEAREHWLGDGHAGIGSDSNVRISAIEELRQLEYGQRLRDRRRARLATDRGVGGVLWSWLVEGGNRAAGLTQRGLEPGGAADLVVLDPESPGLAGHEPETALDAWLVGGDGRDIEAVYVRGERLVDHGRVAAEEEIRARFAKTMRALWSA